MKINSMCGKQIYGNQHVFLTVYQCNHQSSMGDIPDKYDMSTIIINPQTPWESIRVYSKTPDERPLSDLRPPHY